MMSFRIEYLREGEVLAAVPFIGSRENALKAASAGITQHRAKAARVVDMDSGGELVMLIEGKSRA